MGILGGEASALLTRIGLDPNTLEEQVGALARDVATWLGGAATSIVAGLMSAVFIFIFTAITSYYLLREGAEGRRGWWRSSPSPTRGCVSWCATCAT